MITSEFLHKLDRFSLLINKRITSNYVGEREANATGRGLIFKDHIMYSPGEDFRSIDWRVFGRTDKLFVKRYEEERNATVHIILDTSGSMNFGSHIKKVEYAGMIGIGFAYLALKNNERFVLGTFSESLEVFKPRKGRSQIANMVEYINNLKPAGKSLLDRSLGGYKKLINSRSLVVLLSDFLYPLEDIKKALRHLKSHQVIVVQVLDKVERKLEMEGDFKLKDVETENIMHTFINPFARKQYHEMLENHIAELHKACDEVGAKFYSAHSGQDVFDVMYDILMVRR